MPIAGVEAYVNHPVVALGRLTGCRSWSLGEEGASACDTHVVVRVRAQSELVEAPVPGREVDGHGPPLDAVVDDVADRADHLTVAVAPRSCLPRPSSQAGAGNDSRTTVHSASAMSER